MDLKQRTNIKLPTPEFRFQYFLPFILYKQDPKVSVPVMLDLLEKKKKGKIRGLIEITFQQNPNLSFIL